MLTLFARRARILCTAIAALAVVLAGCGGGDDGPPGSGASGSTGDAVTGGILSVGVTASLGRLESVNPFADNLYGSWMARQLIYPALVQLKGTELEPAWAESWDVSDDGRVYTFHLQEGEWSDGTSLTAADAEWTAQFVLDHADGAAGLVSFALEGVESVEATDDQTLVITYAEPIAEDVLTLLSNFHVLPKHVYEPHAGNDGADMLAFRPESELPVVAGGPFTVTEFDPDGTTIFEPNSSYYGEPPLVAAVGIQVFQNDEGLAQALRAGDVVWGLNSGSSVATSVEGAPGVAVVTSPSQDVALLNINSNPEKPDHPELRELQVREAISLAINRDELIEVVLDGFGAPGRSVLAPFQDRWIPSGIEPDSYDADEANRILDGLGYERGPDGTRRNTDGEPMVYEIVVWEEITRVVEILQKNLEAIGIELTQDIASDYTAAVTAPDGKYLDFDMAYSYWSLGPEPGGMLRVYSCASWGSVNFAGFCDENYDQLLEEQRSEMDPAARTETIGRLQEILLRESRAVLPLYHADSVQVVAEGWTGIEVDRFGPALWTQVHRSE